MKFALSHELYSYVLQYVAEKPTTLEEFVAKSGPY